MLLDMIIWGESPITLRRITICTCQVDLYFQVIFHKLDYCIIIYVSGVPSETSDCKHPVRVRRCKSFHCKSCHSLHALSLPPNSPSTINPLRFYLPPTFILTETLSRSLVISLREKKQPVWLIASFSASLCLLFSISLLPSWVSFSLCLSFSACVCLRQRERERESSASFLTHWLISARPSLGSIPTPTGDPGAGEKQEVGCVWWRQFTGGVVWLHPLCLYCQAQPMPISRAGDIELLLP